MSTYLLGLDDTEVARYRFMAAAAEQAEHDQWVAAGVVPGAAVADVGCGPGAVSAALARLVGPTGRVLAIDRDPAAVALARQWAAQQGLANLEASVGTAQDSGLSPASVDVAMMRHVLAHNGGHEQAVVDHLATLVRPGGCVYVVDIEGSAMRMHPPDELGVLREMAERYGRLHASLGNDLSVGLRLGELLERAGLQLLDHTGRYQVVRTQPGMRPPAWAARQQMLATGVIDEDDVRRWQSELERMDRGELAFTMFVPVFTAFARRPL